MLAAFLAWIQLSMSGVIFWPVWAFLPILEY